MMIVSVSAQLAESGALPAAGITCRERRSHKSRPPGRMQNLCALRRFYICMSSFTHKPVSRTCLICTAGIPLFSVHRPRASAHRTRKRGNHDFIIS